PRARPRAAPLLAPPAQAVVWDEAAQPLPALAGDILVCADTGSPQRAAELARAPAKVTAHRGEGRAPRPISRQHLDIERCANLSQLCTERRPRRRAGGGRRAGEIWSFTEWWEG